MYAASTAFNGELGDECLNGEVFYSLKEAQIIIERWRVHYNTRRRHSSLGTGHLRSRRLDRRLISLRALNNRYPIRSLKPSESFLRQ